MMHPPDMWVGKSALDGKIMEHTFKVENGKCLLNVFKDSEVEIKKILKKMLEREKTVKTYIGVKIRMKKCGVDGGTIKKNNIEVWFEGGIRALYSETCVDLLYELALIDIMEDFEAYIEKRDGWVFETVVNLQLYTVKYNSTNEWKYIPTPKFIDHAVVNIKNEEDDDCCFLWSIIAALSSKDRVSFNAPTNIEYYKMLKHKQNLKFGGITPPIKIEAIPTWEEMHDIPLAVYGVEENGENVYPLYYTSRRDKEPINLLVIEGEGNYHYAWIKNLDCLMVCQGRQNDERYDATYYTCQCMMYQTREEFIQPRWLLDEEEEDDELVKEIEDLVGMEYDAFTCS
jgi:hypothetical protein